MDIIIMDSKQKKILGAVVGVTTLVLAAFFLKTYVFTSCKKQEKPSKD